MQGSDAQGCRYPLYNGRRLSAAACLHHHHCAHHHCAHHHCLPYPRPPTPALQCPCGGCPPSPSWGRWTWSPAMRSLGAGRPVPSAQDLTGGLAGGAAAACKPAELKGRVAAASHIWGAHPCALLPTLPQTRSRASVRRTCELAGHWHGLTVAPEPGWPESPVHHCNAAAATGSLPSRANAASRPIAPLLGPSPPPILHTHARLHPKPNPHAPAFSARVSRAAICTFCIVRTAACAAIQVEIFLSPLSIQHEKRGE